MGSELNNALKVLIHPQTPESLTYAAIKSTLINHFDSEKNKYAESIKFRKLQQEPGETLANFTIRLKQGAAYCEYGDFLDRMLIEQLLFGLIARDICKEIISKKPATFAAAYEIAHAMELSQDTTTKMQLQTD